MFPEGGLQEAKDEEGHATEGPALLTGPPPRQVYGPEKCRLFPVGPASTDFQVLWGHSGTYSDIKNLMPVLCSANSVLLEMELGTRPSCSDICLSGALLKPFLHGAVTDLLEQTLIWYGLDSFDMALTLCRCVSTRQFLSRASLRNNFLSSVFRLSVLMEFLPCCSGFLWESQQD